MGVCSDSTVSDGPEKGLSMAMTSRFYLTAWLEEQLPPSDPSAPLPWLHLRLLCIALQFLEELGGSSPFPESLKLKIYRTLSWLSTGSLNLPQKPRVGQKR